ncbi:MAG: hypothetical protein EPO08_11430 [Rhodospirillaceae bacterium]|nr:MAG: hypothetical protein EPO08_11430 [Rhodospirillaceae bacterium]
MTHLSAGPSPTMQVERLSTAKQPAPAPVPLKKSLAKMTAPDSAKALLSKFSALTEQLPGLCETRVRGFLILMALASNEKSRPDLAGKTITHICQLIGEIDQTERTRHCLRSMQLSGLVIYAGTVERTHTYGVPEHVRQIIIAFAEGLKS